MIINRRPLLIATALTLSIFFISIGISTESTAQNNLFTQAERAQLSSGRSVYHALPGSGENGFYGGTSWTVVNAPFEKIWKAILDFSMYPSTFPKVIETEEISKKQNKSLVRMRIGLKLISLEYYLDVDISKKKKKIVFNLVDNRPHDVESSTGYWRFFPQKNGTTLVAYVVSTKLPVGVVNLLSDESRDKLGQGLLNFPRHLKYFVESGNKYKHSEK